MQDVELVGPLADLLQHQHVRGDRVTDRVIEAQCAWPRRGKIRTGS